MDLSKVSTAKLEAELYRREQINAEKADAKIAESIAKKKPIKFKYCAGGDERETIYELYFYLTNGKREVQSSHSIERLKDFRIKYFPNLPEEWSPWS